jgi:hypothetical protein
MQKTNSTSENTKWWLSMALILLCVAGMAQQVIHIDNRRMADTTKGFSGEVSLQANLVQNLNDIFQTNNMAQFHYINGRHRALSISSFNLTVFNESRIANDAYQHLRYNFELTDRLSPEVFAQYQYNELIKIGFRTLHGAGMRFAVLNNDSAKTKLFAGLSYMYEYEEETTGKIIRAHRANFYFSAGLPVGRLIHLDAIAYFQPNLQYFADVRTSVELIVDVHITRRLSLMLVHSLIYDGAPPEGVRNIFYNFRNGLRYRF